MLTDFNKFRDQCHIASVNAGWWMGSERYPEGLFGQIYDPDRLTIPTKLCLVHSEISEAYEGYMSGANDEHLPEWPNALVEFADTIIRIADLAGYLEINMTSAIAMVEQCDYIGWERNQLTGKDTGSIYYNGRYHDGPGHWFILLHTFTSGAMESYRKGNRMDVVIPHVSGVSLNLARIVILIDLICQKNNWNLIAAAQAKIAYNAVREDHKLEVRGMDGGKAF